MIALIEGLPDAVIGIEAVGDVTSQDDDEVVAPAMERALASGQKVRLLHVLDDRPTPEPLEQSSEEVRA